MHPRLARLTMCLLAAAVFVGCSASDNLEQKRSAEAKKRTERAHAAAKAAINTLAMKADAVVDWRSQLGSTDFAAVNRVYTVDLERVWIGPRPILFLGVLEDVAPHDKTSYHLFVRDKDLFSPEVRLHLVCPKDTVAPVLKAVRADKETFLPGAIAITARVARVDHEMFFDRENTKHIFIGHGNCVDLAYVGDSLEVN